MRTTVGVAIALGLLVPASVLSVSSTPEITSAIESGSTATPAEAWTWSLFHASNQPDALSVADLDLDGRAELVVTGRPVFTGGDPGGYWFIEDADGAPRQVWSSYSQENEVRGVLALDSGASPARILVRTSASILVQDAPSREVLRSIALPSASTTDFHVADIDDSVGLEVLVCDPDNLYVIDFESGELIRTRHGFGCSRLDVGQTDSDVQLEIALAGNSLAGFVLDGLTLEVDWADLSGFGWWVGLHDIDGDLLDEVISRSGEGYGLRAQNPRTGETLWQADGTFDSRLEITELGAEGSAILAFDWDENRLVVLDPADGQALWSLSLPYENCTALAAANVDDDDAFEILLAFVQDGIDPGAALLVVDSSARQIQADSPFHRRIASRMAAGDVDADGQPDLVVGTQRALYDWRPLLFDVRTRRDHEPPEGLPLHDGPIDGIVLTQLDRDPQLEICAFAACVTCFDGISFEPEAEICLPGDERAAAVMALDLEGDGRSEVLVVSDDGYVRAFTGLPPTVLWTSPRIPGTLNNPHAAIRAGQVDSDPGLEIVLAGVGYSRGEVVVLDSTSGSIDYGPFSLFATTVATVPAGGALPDRLVVGTEAGDVAELDPATGQLGPPLATFPPPVRALAVADLTRDGEPDLLVGSDGRIWLYGGSEQAIIWVSPFLDDSAAELDSLLAGDVDRDTLPDVTAFIGIGFAVFEAPLIPLLIDGFETGDTSRWSSSVP